MERKYVSNKKSTVDTDLQKSDDDNYTVPDIASNTECTGMVPAPPLDDAEVEGYTDIYSVPQQQAKNAREMKVKGGKQVPR